MIVPDVYLHARNITVLGYRQYLKKIWKTYSIDARG